jgi:hypothetical protein
MTTSDDNTLDTENHVFNKFKNDFGDDPSTDILDQIMIQGTPELEANKDNPRRI